MVDDLVNSEPFSNYDLSEFFGAYLTRVVGIINVLHNVISYSPESDTLRAAETVAPYRYQ